MGPSAREDAVPDHSLLSLLVSKAVTTLLIDVVDDGDDKTHCQLSLAGSIT